MWVLGYLNDLESDFSAFHRVDDIYEMDGPRFFRLAVRLPAYDGVMRARLANEREDEEPTRPSTRSDGSNVVDLAQFSAAHPGLIDRKRVAHGV